MANDFMSKYSLLTKTEMKVCKHILDGLSNHEISDILCVVVASVKFHAANIYSKFEVAGRVQLICSYREKYLELSRQIEQRKANEAKKLEDRNLLPLGAMNESRF